MTFGEVYVAIAMLVAFTPCIWVPMFMYYRRRHLFPISARGYVWSFLSMTFGYISMLIMCLNIIMHPFGGLSCWPVVIMRVMFTFSVFAPLQIRGLNLVWLCRYSEVIALSSTDTSRWVRWKGFLRFNRQFTVVLLLLGCLFLTGICIMLFDESVEEVAGPEDACSAIAFYVTAAINIADAVFVFIIIVLGWNVKDVFHIKKELTCAFSICAPGLVVWFVAKYLFVNLYIHYYVVIFMIMSVNATSIIYPLWLTYHDSSMYVPGASTEEIEITQSMTLEDILHNSVLLDAFAEYCVESWCVELLLFCQEVNNFTQIPFSDKKKRRESRNYIIKRFVEKGSPLEINIVHQIHKEIIQSMETDDIEDTIFIDAVNACEQILETDVLRRWKQHSPAISVVKEASLLSIRESIGFQSNV